MATLKAIATAVISGKAVEVSRLVEECLAAGIKPTDIINNGLVSGMETIAERFKNNDIYIPEVFVAARAMTAGLSIVKPLISASDLQPVGKVVIGTVKGDLHDIGKKLVAMMLEGAGFAVIDLGVDISPERFVSAIKEHQPHLLGMSSLLTTTMPNMAQTIKLIVESGLRDQVKIIIGGAPVTEAYSNEIGADGYAADAGSAVDLAKALLN
jgi:5-methyltetrahydrofolate--homocysteine methyltransferase